jgi:hypothetical protein
MAAKGVTLGQRVASFVNHPAGPKTSACAALLLRRAALRPRCNSACATLSPPPLRRAAHALAAATARVHTACAGARNVARSAALRLPGALSQRQT